MDTQTMTQQIAEYFKTQPVLKAWLFGSYSRGEQRADSDVDILILPDKQQHFSLFTLSEIYEDLKELLGCEVDVITVGGLMPFARESADRDKILIYEKGYGSASLLGNELRNDPKRLKDILQAIDTIFEYVGGRGMKEFLADKRSWMLSPLTFSPYVRRL